MNTLDGDELKKKETALKLGLQNLTESITQGKPYPILGHIVLNNGSVHVIPEPVGDISRLTSFDYLELAHGHLVIALSKAKCSRSQLIKKGSTSHLNAVILNLEDGLSHIYSMKLNLKSQEKKDAF